MIQSQSNYSTSHECLSIKNRLSIPEIYPEFIWITQEIYRNSKYPVNLFTGLFPIPTEDFRLYQGFESL